MLDCFCGVVAKLVGPCGCVLSSEVAKENVKRWSSIQELAQKHSIQAHDGFTSMELRFLFNYSEQLKLADPKSSEIICITPKGEENRRRKIDKKDVEGASVFTYVYPQTMEATLHDKLSTGSDGAWMAPYVFKQGTNVQGPNVYSVVQMWPVVCDNTLKQKYSMADIKEEADIDKHFPAEKIKEMKEAWRNFRSVLQELFGDLKQPIQVCTPETQTTSKYPVFVGTATNLLAFIKEPGVQNFFSIRMKNTHEFGSVYFNLKCCGIGMMSSADGQKMKFDFGPIEDQRVADSKFVLYQRESKKSRFTCIRLMEQFDKEGRLGQSIT